MSISEAGWRKNRSAQTLRFQAAEMLSSPLSCQQQRATRVDLPTPLSRIASLPVYSHGYCDQRSQPLGAKKSETLLKHE